MTARATGKWLWRTGVAVLLVLPAACNNSPYSEEEEGQNILYTTFSTEPNHMDPGQSYAAFDHSIIGNVLETPFEYHYLKQPYELIPMTAVDVPKARQREVTFGEKTHNATVYTIRLKPGTLYHDHPCFVPSNRRLTAKDVRGVRDVWDIKPTATREALAKDYVHAIRRLADPRLACPLYPTFAKHFLGMAEYRSAFEEKLEKAREARKAAAGPLYNPEQGEKYNPVRIDYGEGAEKFPFAKEIDKYTFEIVLGGPYPPILYWMAMPFFSPVPAEAIEFFNQRPLLERSIVFDKNLVGTGPFIMRQFDPTNQIVLERNPKYRLQRYPSLPRPTGDDPKALQRYDQMKAAGILENAGKRLPMIDRIVWRVEKESIPRWNKFLQGYYDESVVRGDFFDQTVRLSSQGDSVLTDELSELGVRLVTSQLAGFYYYVFNMNDPVIGRGAGEAGRKLRHAISVAFDTEEEIAVFESGRGVPSHGPIPPGIFGSELGRIGINPVVYRWDAEGNRPVRRSLDEAKKLLAEAGYPNGYGKDGQPLTIQFVTGWSSAEGRSQVRFVRKQFEKLNIRLKIETSDSNRFNEKVRSGSFQFIHWGWRGDYPDPENFLFLMYGPHGKVKSGGENHSNYDSEEYNRLFQQMAAMENTPERLEIIRKMLKILRYDAPVIFGHHPVGYGLYHDWYRGVWPNAIAMNTQKYHRIDPVRRAAYRKEHNTPRVWPVVAFLALLGASAIPAFRIAARRLREV